MGEYYERKTKKVSFKDFDKKFRDIALEKGKRTYISIKACIKCGSHNRNVRNFECYSCELRKQKEQYAKKHNRQKHTNSRIKRTYGIDLLEYETMLIEQNDGCALCGMKEEDQNRRLAIDHCHTTGKVRGLLCNKCNVSLSGLEYFMNGDGIFLKAINYLGKHK